MSRIWTPGPARRSLAPGGGPGPVGAGFVGHLITWAEIAEAVITTTPGVLSISAPADPTHTFDFTHLTPKNNNQPVFFALDIGPDEDGSLDLWMEFAGFDSANTQLQLLAGPWDDAAGSIVAAGCWLHNGSVVSRAASALNTATGSAAGNTSGDTAPDNCVLVTVREDAGTVTAVAQPAPGVGRLPESEGGETKSGAGTVGGRLFVSLTNLNANDDVFGSVRLVRSAYGRAVEGVNA